MREEFASMCQDLTREITQLEDLRLCAWGLAFRDFRANRRVSWIPEAGQSGKRTVDESKVQQICFALRSSVHDDPAGEVGNASRKRPPD